MTILSKALNILGSVLLAHACYSAQEHLSFRKSPSTELSSSSASLPLDIILETLISVLIICLGLVLGSPALRPISWRVWAGKIERESRRADGGMHGLGANPFLGLESRVGFWDIRAKRKEFEEWVRERDAVVKS